MEAWINSLNENLAGITQSLIYRDCADTLAIDSKLLITINSSLEDLEARIAKAVRALSKEQEQLQTLRRFTITMNDQQNWMKIMQTNLPARLPGQCLQDITHAPNKYAPKSKSLRTSNNQKAKESG